MFIDKQSEDSLNYYSGMLSKIAGLSRLFSGNSQPYLYYRIAENLFCKAFSAENLSRGDTSADASRDGMGFGIKTFLYKNGQSLEKVAEFNSEHTVFANLPPDEKIRKIAELRNLRIEATKRIHDLAQIIYHCVVRRDSEILVYEKPMRTIDLGNITDIVVNGNAITFNDGIESYSFYIPKSTLMMRFETKEVLLKIPVNILEDPFKLIENVSIGKEQLTRDPSDEEVEQVILPLYGMKSGTKVVFEKSGLNQWNASGRKRDYDEIYIPIPAWIQNQFQDFFPPRDVPFNLFLPNQKVLSAKVCQDGSKALMTNPNSALGEWLLRDVMGLNEGELVTYAKLEEIGLDSVVITKDKSGGYKIDFTEIGTYEKFNQLNNPL